MKLHVILCMAVLLLFSACTDLQNTAASMASDSLVVSSSHSSSCEAPAPEEEPSEEPEPVLSEKAQHFPDPNSETEALLYPDGNVVIISNDDRWTVENAGVSFNRLEWSDSGCLKYLDGEKTVLLYSPSEKAFLCTGVPLYNG